MPKYKIVFEGKEFVIEGDNPPTEAELINIYSELYGEVPELAGELPTAEEAALVPEEATGEQFGYEPQFETAEPETWMKAYENKPFINYQPEMYESVRVLQLVAQIQPLCLQLILLLVLLSPQTLL